ncbi:TPA: hypothetical protein ACN359_004516 [Vibrio parahaemolyticus]|nr:hypothetical protein [Vibrio parahaemolyticus]
MKLSNGNLVDATGKTTFVSIEAFESEVCNSDVCILCTKVLESGNHNKEHVIPNWILKKFNLHNETVNLPNGTKFKYGQYVIPCCIECNSLLSEELEVPLSKAFSGGFDGVMEYLKQDGYLKVYLWLALIFVKTHIKDQSLRMYLNKNLEHKSIAEGVGYEWEIFHHIYCLSRVPYTKSNLDSNCIGSLFFIEIDNVDNEKDFDYMDVSFANTSGIIVNNVGVIAVFGDAGAVENQLRYSVLPKLGQTVTSMQFRELVANFACCNLHLKNPPNHSTISDESGIHPPTMICKLNGSKPDFESYKQDVFGNIMDMLLGELLDGKVAMDNFRERLRKGEVSILFDSSGELISPNKLLKSDS